MTAKEKAQELVVKYYVEAKEYIGYYDIEASIQCDILNFLPLGDRDFWQEVRKELELKQH